MKKTFQNVIFDIKDEPRPKSTYFAIMLSTGILQRPYSSDMMVIVGLSAENSEMLLRICCCMGAAVGTQSHKQMLAHK